MIINARESLIACLLEMAEAETNPVLELIDRDKPLEENKKYPSELLQFKEMGWRAYYHCHPALRSGNHRFKNEHGHFHLFVRIQTNPETWSHLIALAMDNMGQPIGWFSVNHWVTGEVWENASNLVRHLTKIPFDRQDSLVECWLLSLLDLNHEAVKKVLYERDKIMKLKQDQAGEEESKQDRGLYLLSESVINLKELIGV